MGRIIGLIGGTCLIIAVLRLTNLQHDDRTLLGGVEPATALSRQTPRQLYRQGKELYLRGRVDEALPLLEAATASTSGLTAVDRRDAEDYLGRTRQKIAQRATGVDVRGQSPEQDPFTVSATKAAAPASEEAARASVTRWMKLAQESLAHGDKADAIKFAERARDIAAKAQLKFAASEISPAAFLAKLQGPAAASTSVPEWATDGNAPKTTAEPVAATKSAAPQGLSEKDQAQSLLLSAREDVKAGRFDEARQKAMQAEELDVTYDLFDIRPAHIYAEVDRRTGGVTVTKPRGPQSSAGPAVATNAAPKTADDKPASAPSGDSQRLQVQKLLQAAREDLKNGNLEGAKQKAEKASEFMVAYKLFDDRPELVLNDVAAAMAAANIAQATAPAAADETAPAAASPDGKASARQLLAQARKALEAGKLEEARQLALQADKLKAAYGLFDDRPDLVLTDIEHVASHPPAAPPKTSSISQPAETSKVQTVAATATEEPADPKAQARQLLIKARKAMDEGRLDEARQYATQARQLKVNYGLFDDRPDLVLADLARRAASQAAVNTKPASKEPAVEPRTPSASAAPFASEATAKVETPSPTPAAEAAFPPAAPTAASAAPVEPAPAAAIAAAPEVSNQQQIDQLLREARGALNGGRFEEARAKAEAAEKLHGSYDILDDRPDLVLADIAAKTAAASKATAVQRSDEPVETADVPFNAVEKPAKTFAPAAAEVHNITELAPNGLSALQLYNQGMSLLGRGDRAGAHKAFLAAHQSGQRLDPVRQQRLQNYLRELAPRSSSKIQLVNNQLTDNDVATGPEVAPATTLLDSVEQQQSVQFERLRTETLNAVFRAERMRAKNPEQALQIIEQSMAAVEGADLPPESSMALLKSLEKTRSSLQAEIARQQPNIEQARHNQEVLEQIRGRTEQAIHIEQEFARLVEEFNTLYEQRRFAEAEVVAKKAKELDPRNPVAETLFWKARIVRRVDSNEKLKLNKEETFWKTLDDVEQTLVHNISDNHPMDFPKDWKDLSDRRRGKYRADNRPRTDEELRIQQSLEKRISLHEEGTPLSEVIKKISAVADIDIFFDPLGLEDEGVTSNTPVTINVDGIKVKSALNLMLESHHLAYIIHNDVLKITSRMRQQGDLVTATYPVADLVVPIPSYATTLTNPLGVQNIGAGGSALGGGQFSVPPLGGQPFAQVGLDGMGGLGNASGLSDTNRLGGGSATPDFNTLVDLISTTIAPDSWQEVGGNGSIRHYETTLSLVVRQTQRVHEEIADLLEQLRRLQDLQVTIEVRFVTVSDRFFERIGIDFDFDIQSTVGGPDTDNNNVPLLPFGSVRVPQAGFSVQGQQQQGQQQQGQQAQQAQAGAAGFFTQPPTRELTNRSDYPSGTIVGLSQPQQFSQSLDIPFQQGSFEIGVPQFGGFQPNAGIQFGLAVLSDIEAFFFVQAAQGDQRANLMFAPKVTLFNGQSATVTSNVQRPFVISLIPTVGFFSTGFQPVIQFFPDGVSLTVQAVISADRRFVRLTVFPLFTNITDVFTFSFVGGANANVGGGGQLGGQGGGFGGGGFGGGGFGGGFGGGQFGIGGGMGTTQMVMNSLFSQQQQGGQQGQRAQQGQAAGGLTVTVQQPVLEIISVNTTVSVPDGGTVLLGGVKRLREGRSMAGVPILNKVPYLSRLFKNTGVGRETESVMLMVTPRIIIQEEEEELLGIPVGQ